MKRWFPVILITLCLTEVAVGVFVGWEIYRRRQAQVLGVGAVSLKDRSLNPHNAQSTLKYYTEPISNQKEQDQASFLQENVEWTYNSDALNERFEYPIQKPPKTVRILTLGDSFTFGDHVNTADNWTERLEDLLNTKNMCPSVENYEVINLGVCGYDIPYSVERYRLRGEKYHPDLVLWMLISNDFDEIAELLAAIVIPIRSELEKTNSLSPADVIRISDSKARDEFLRRYDEKKRFAIVDEYIEKFNMLYKGPLALLTFPFLEDQYKQYIQQWVKQRDKTYYFDGLPDIYADDTLSFRAFDDGHPTAKAHALIAQTIYEYLQKNSLISCN